MTFNQPEGKPPRLLTTAQAAERLNIPDNTLRYWRHRREGPPSVKLGNLVRYDADQLEAWLTEQYEAAAADYA